MLVTFSELPTKQTKGELVAGERELGIITITFVAQERVRSIHFVPREIGPRRVEGGVDFHPPLQRHMRVLPSPNHQELAFDFRNPIERVILHALSESAFVDVRRVKTGGRENVRIHRGTKCKVAADADSNHAEFPGALRETFQIREDGSSIRVVSRNFLRGFQGVAAIRACLIVGEHDARSLELVINFRHRDNEPVAREECGGATNRAGDLENFREQKNPWVTARGVRLKDIRPHRSARSGEIDVLGFFDGHKKKQS